MQIQNKKIKFIKSFAEDDLESSSSNDNSEQELDFEEKTEQYYYAILVSLCEQFYFLKFSKLAIYKIKALKRYAKTCICISCVILVDFVGSYL